MSEDVKPRRFEIFYSGLANTFSVRDNFHAYIMARKQENLDDEYIRLIELEPTMRLIDELADILETSAKRNISPRFYAREVLEKYRKFKEALK